jgi:hypothetical protein
MLRKVGKHVLIAAASVVFGFVAGFIGAFLTSPIWGWFEDITGLESLGHSGPADWVFDFMFGLCIIGLFVLLEWIYRKPPTQPRSTATGES